MMTTGEREAAEMLMRFIDSDCPHDLTEARHLISQFRMRVRWATKQEIEDQTNAEKKARR